jgi:hypothetical protein
MAQHKLRSRIAQFKQPFLVGAVTSAALLSGCGGETAGTGTQPDNVIGNPQTPDVGATINPPGVFWTCPDPAPAPGDACPTYLEGRECGPDAGIGVRCVQGAWASTGDEVTQNPPPVLTECPANMPASGASCDEHEPGSSCQYDSDSSCSREFECNDGEWVDVSPTCNPPPPELSSVCPVMTPEFGEGCDQYVPELNCEYGSDSSCPREFTCRDGAWSDHSPACNPPPPQPSTECPTDAPVLGDNCAAFEVGLSCVEATCEGGVGIYCGGSGVWEAVWIACNPPPPETDVGIDAGAGVDESDGG